MPTNEADLNRLRENDLNWPEGQIHNGNHPGSYYEGLADRLDQLPANPTIEDVIGTMNEISVDITEGRLFPAGS